MKFYSILQSSVLLLLIFLFASCQKDIDQIIPVESKSYTTNVFGTVTDEEGNAISNALVNFRGNMTRTDEYGTYLFKAVSVDSRYNHINISKEDYFVNTRTFRGNRSETILLKSVMVPALFDHSFTSNGPQTIEIESVKIEFDGKGMIVEEGGQSYEGEVNAAVHYINPMDNSTAQVMPGDLSAINSAGNFRLLESFGMIGVELKSNDGQKLQLADQSEATITIKIPNEILADAPDEIPLWHFNHDLGLWEEDGKAVKVGNTYVGNVTHFSFWNFDLQREPVMVSGRIIDNNGIGVASMQIKIVRGNERRGGSGYTDYDGYFNGPVEKGVALELSVVSRCNGEEIVYSEQIGPLEEEADLGDIVVDIPNIEYLTVRGEFTNCEGEVMEDGLLKINDLDRPNYFPVIGGKIDKTFGICGLESIELEMIDRQELQKKSLGTFDVPGEAVVDVTKVCDDPVSFVSISSPTYDFDLVLLDSVLFSSIQWSKTLLSFDYSYEVAVFEIKYVDQDEFNIEEGTHKILKMVCNWLPEGSTEEIVLVLYEGNINIEEVNNENRTVKGSFLFEATIAGTSDRHAFEGNFLSYF